MRFFVILFVLYISVYGNHDWNGYHWNPSNLNLLVKDDTTSSLYNVIDVMNDWNNLNTSIHLKISSINPNIKVSEAFNPHWLGLARIYLENGHIVEGQVKLNTKLLTKYYGLTETGKLFLKELNTTWGALHQADDKVTSEKTTK